MFSRCLALSSGLLKTVVMAALLTGCAAPSAKLAGGDVDVVDVGPGWANNSVNTVSFRKNALVSAGGMQFVAFYDGDGRVVLGKRPQGGRNWTLHRTQYRGDVSDAHKAISIMADGGGVLHVSWDHHDNALRYARGLQPGSLALGGMQAMTGQDEGSVTYPEFHRLPDGDLLFLYRDGRSGRGNLVVNRYDTARGRWQRLSSNLISGEGVRSAYWQTFVDGLGVIHLSWVWRDSPDVASNHDLAYARSRDGGRTWEKSGGEPYVLPITATSAEYAARIPTNSELINQTSMSADAAGRPYIASYWRDPDSPIPQYRVVHLTAGGWKTLTLGFRTMPFSLGGGGTKAIPIARPQIMVDASAAHPGGLLVFRDAERGNRVSVVDIARFEVGGWALRDLTAYSVGAWEPGYDTELWRTHGIVNLFVQEVSQVDGEGRAARPPSMVRVLQWQPPAH